MTMIEILAIDNGDALSPEVFDGLLPVVSEERKQRAKRFLRREDACRCIVGEALARYSIGKRENVSPRSIEFKINGHGKPYCELPRGTQFSISHSGSWVACATDEGAVGIDVERIHPVSLDIARRFFSSREHDDIMSLPNEDTRRERFFEIWTLKESYIKALGRGLSCQLSSFSIACDSGGVAMTADGDLPAMFFKRYAIGPGYKCAVCAAHDNFPSAIEILSPQRLLSYF